MIPALVPALTLYGFSVRSVVPRSDIQIVETNQPGYVARLCRMAQSEAYAILRKRYLVDTLGQSMGPPSGAGLTPPPVSFVGIPVSGDLEIVIQVTASGPLGVAAFQWSQDAGRTWKATGVLTAASVPLTGTGVSLLCPPGTYDVSNIYTAATPVPEIVLGWLVDMVSPRVYTRRGVNAAQDDQIDKINARGVDVRKDLKEAANSRDGLYDLPLNTDAGGSGITQGGPLASSSASPYAWTDTQARRGRAEDGRGYER